MPALRRSGQKCAEIARLSLVGVVVGAALSGALSSSASLTPTVALQISAVGFLLHVSAFVLNDVADVEIDRSDPRRAGFPMVTGAFPVWAGVVLAVGCTVLSVALDAAFFHPAAVRQTELLGAYAALIAYDFTGKRCRLPPLTDFLQGVGGACVVLYGASAAGGMTTMTCASAAYTAVYLALVNGLHGGVRDYENDAAVGARTTAVMFGVTCGPEGAVLIPAPFRWYAWTLQVLLGAVVAGGLAVSLSASSADVTEVAGGCFCVLSVALSALLLRAALGRPKRLTPLKLLGAAHIVAAYLPIAGLACTHRGTIRLAVCVLFMALPLIANPWFRRGITQLVHGGGGMGASGGCA
ncbi:MULTISPECIES: UbiA family prenyltransferase [unclassified Streptomyces]|uniref:UbiA family prenyltransferase n=1 Tax=unclassified Streptomyces TaxID=2593676 RepID=UPI0036A158E3